MARSFAYLITFLALVGLLAFGGCSGADYASGCQSDADCSGQKCHAGACVQCKTDGDCGGNVCTACNNHQCVKVANCCGTDADCGSGRRCWNVAGTKRGKCGSAR